MNRRDAMKSLAAVPLVGTVKDETVIHNTNSTPASMFVFQTRVWITEDLLRHTTPPLGLQKVWK